MVIWLKSLVSSKIDWLSQNFSIDPESDGPYWLACSGLALF
jgi:hypothetical protein